MNEQGAYGRRALELRAAAYYASIRKPESEWKTIEDLTPQLAEFEHCIHAQNYDKALHVLETIDYDYLHLWGYYTRLLEMHENLLLKSIPLKSQVANLERLGSVYRALGQSPLALQLYKKGLALVHQNGTQQITKTLFGHLGSVYLELWQVELALKFYEEALHYAREHKDRAAEGRYLGNLGIVYYLLRDIASAIDYYETAYAIAHENGQRRRESVYLGNLGNAYLALGQNKKAIKYFEQALTIAQTLGYRRVEGVLRCNLGNAYQNMGESETAIQFHREALNIATKIQYQAGKQRYLSSLGNTYYTIGNIEQATLCYQQALNIAEKINDIRGESYQLLGMGELSLFTGQLTAAQKYCMQSRALNIPETSYRAALILGIALLHQQAPNIIETFNDAVTRCQILLNRTSDLYKPRYALATALLGQTVCESRWSDSTQRSGLLLPIFTEYRRALDITSAPGVVRDAIRDLELIRAAGIEGLEPVFDLLEGALNEPA